LPRKVNIAKSLDWITILVYFLLTTIGWLNIYSSSYSDEHKSIFDFTQLYGKQLIWISAAYIIGILLIIIESRAYHAFAYIIYAIAIVSLILVFIFAPEVKGARAWIEIYGYKLQPGEFSKIAVNLALARFLSTYDMKISKTQNIFLAAILLLVPITLIIMQKDTGSAITYIVFIIVLFREGLFWWIPAIGLYAIMMFVMALLYPPIAVVFGIFAFALTLYGIIEKEYKKLGLALIIFGGLVSLFELINQIFIYKYDFDKLVFASILISLMVYLVLAVKFRVKIAYFFIAVIIGTTAFIYSTDYMFNKILQRHQQVRINVLLGREQDEKGVGYNVNQSIIAIGSGGVNGKGFLEGTQTKFNFVPEQSTDFIFCTIGEEWGFMGTLFMILLFMFLLLRLIFLAERQRSVFSRIYGYGVLSIFFFHFVINIGMTIGLMPVIGIPLPFISYGGSSLWSFTILLFIFLRLDASRTELL